MALPDQQKHAGQPLARLKQYFDRIRLTYIERRSGNATIIQVQPKGDKDLTDPVPHFDDKQRTRRF